MDATVELLILFAGGMLAGALGGMLGIGGGIVLMPLLRFSMGLSPAYAAGTCVLAVFSTTLGGSYRHYRLGHLHLRSLLPIILSGAAASGAFSFAFFYLARRGRWLDLGMGLVFALISTRMILEGLPAFRRDPVEQTEGSIMNGGLLGKISIGAAGGVLPGLLGIGTGGILVPAFTFILGAPVKIAMAASLACFCCNALISAALKYSQGFVVMAIALPICCGAIVGANVGAILNKQSASGNLKLLFGIVFFYVSVKFIASFVGAMS